MKQDFQTRLTGKRQLTPTMLELTLEITNGLSLDFKAGQYALLHVPQSPKPITRSYSFASDDRCKNGFTLLVKLVPGGIASEYIASRQIGDSLLFTAPFGKLTFHEPPTSQVLLISTGAGLSQHMSFMLSNAERFPAVQFRALIGVWNEDEMFYQTELQNLRQRFSHFTYEFVLDKPLRPWTGKMGYVTQYFADFDFERIDTTFYLCGNPAMIKSSRDLLKAKNFPKDRIHAEAFV